MVTVRDSVSATVRIMVTVSVSVASVSATVRIKVRICVRINVYGLVDTAHCTPLQLLCGLR